MTKEQEDQITDDAEAQPAQSYATPHASPAEQVSSTNWVGEAPPATPESEGWWWVTHPNVRGGQPIPALVALYEGSLCVHVWEADFSHYIEQYQGKLRWGGRLAVPGASPTDPAHLPPK